MQPHLEVAPGSRRGIVPNAAASALVDALIAIEPLVVARLDERSNAEAASLSDDMHRQLARLFTRVTNFVPHLEWFPVARRSGTVDDAPPSGSAVSPAPEPAPPADTQDERVEQPELFLPGPLFAVTVRPSKLELAVQERKALHAIAADEHGRAIREGVSFEWKASSALSLSAAGNLATIEALSASATESVGVLARQGERERVFIVPVRIVSEHHRRFGGVQEVIQLRRSR